MYKMEKNNQKNAKNAKNKASFLPSPVCPLNKGTLNLPKITEHSVERSAEQGMFGLSLLNFDSFIFGWKKFIFDSFGSKPKSQNYSTCPDSTVNDSVGL